MGDFSIQSLEILDDPCPLPGKVRKALDDKHKLIYAPMSNVDGIMLDRDAVYVDIETKDSNCILVL